MRTIPQINENLDIKDKQIGDLERQMESMAENIKELRRQLDVERIPENERVEQPKDPTARRY